MHEQAQPGAAIPDPDHPANQRLVSNNKELLFEATEFWVMCYATGATQCKVATISSIPGS